MLYRRLILCFVIFSYSLFIIKAQKNIDSLEQLIKIKKDTARINILNELGYILASIDSKKALYFTNNALKESESKKYHKGIADAHWNLGDIYCISTEYTKAIEHTLKAIDLYTETGDDEKLAFSLNLLGTIYEAIELYDKAYDNFIKALKIYERLGIEKQLATMYSNISFIYAIQGKPGLSRKYLDKALSFDLKSKNLTGAAISYSNIANTYLDENNYYVALQYYDSVIPVLEKQQDYYSLAYSYSMFGTVYYNLKNWDKAIELFNLSKECSDKVNNQVEILNSYVNLSQVYLKLRNFNQASEYGLKALQLAEKVNKSKSFVSVYGIMAQISKEQGDFKKAHEYLEKHSQYKDSIKQSELSQKLLSMQTQFETEAKEQQIYFLNKENDLKSSRLYRLRLIIGLAVISLVLSILLIAFLLSRYQIKKKTNKALEIKNNEVEAQRQQIIEINQKLSIQAEELRELDEAKSRFFTNISHEFRTPLTLIIGPLESLIEKAINTDDKDNLSMMLRQANRLLNLVNQLLELSKLQKGKLSFNPEPNNIVKFIGTIVYSFSSFATEAGISINFTENVNKKIVYFDKDSIEKILVNLITNSFKYTQKGGSIDVVVDESAGAIEICVKDTGIGMNSEQLKHIFDPFFQVNENTTKQFNGFGIGLAIVKELVSLYNGEIIVQSSIGTGTEFHIHIPIETVKDNIKEINSGFFTVSTISSVEINPEDNEVFQNVSLSKEKTIILIVEDNPDMSDYICSNLGLDYQIIKAFNGEEGLNKAFEVIPDLIISDVMMPGIDGLEMTKVLKKDKRASHIPIILLTAKASIENKIEGLNTTADDYITKPFNKQELNLRVQNLISNRNKLREKFSKSIQVNPSEITVSSVDEQFLKKALSIIEEHMDDESFSAEKLCSELNMDRSNVHRKLKSLTDKSTTEFIRTIRLKRAAQLLKQRAANVSEIAFQTGFGNLSYFTRCFKEQFGSTPSDFMRI